MRFSAAQKSVFGSFMLGLVVVCAFEAPIVHIASFRAPWLLRLVIAAANVGTIVWLLSLRRRMRDAAFTVDDDGIGVDLGTLWKGRIAWADVSDARVMTTRPPTGVRVRGILRVTPVDAPNVELLVRRPITLAASFGLRKTAPRVQLYVDDPETFVDAVKSRVAPAP